jgi:hypothetical protein
VFVLIQGEVLVMFEIQSHDQFIHITKLGVFI